MKLLLVVIFGLILLLGQLLALDYSTANNHHRIQANGASERVDATLKGNVAKVPPLAPKGFRRSDLLWRNFVPGMSPLPSRIEHDQKGLKK